jgi:Xaa-Pro dipeptidase
VTGLERGIFEDSFVILWPNGKGDLGVSLLEEVSGKNCKKEFNLHIFKDKEERQSLIKQLLGKARLIGLNSRALLWDDWLKLKDLLPKAEFMAVGNEVLYARLIKDEEEIKFLRNACSIASDTAAEIPSLLKEGIKEQSLASEINYLMEKKGAGGPAFETISSFGENTAEPHYTCGKRRLGKGDLVLADFGAIYRRYHSDITRTWVFGKANKLQREIREVVLQAQAAALEEMKREGATTGSVHKITEGFINSTKFKGKFIHSTGHSIGLEVHDGFRLHPSQDIPLKPGMVFTAEPGVYLEGEGGVRIEDDVLIKKGDIEILTYGAKDFEV